MKAHTLRFARYENINQALVAVLVLHSDAYDSLDQVQHAFERAVSEWVNTTDEGRALWFYSCGDLNIGDMMGNEVFDDDNFRSILSDEKLTFGSVASFDTSDAISYDRVLARNVTIAEDEAF